MYKILFLRLCVRSSVIPILILKLALQTLISSVLNIYFHTYSKITFYSWWKKHKSRQNSTFHPIKQFRVFRKYSLPSSIGQFVAN